MGKPRRDPKCHRQADMAPLWPQKWLHNAAIVNKGRLDPRDPPERMENPDRMERMAKMPRMAAMAKC